MTQQRSVGARAGRGRPRHAVIIGGGLAALFAARVLTAHADRVTIVERDRWSDRPQVRAGVPQGRHVHVLLEGGAAAMEELLPGITDELLERGAPRVGMPADTVHWQGGTFHRRTPSTGHLLTGSRPLLEWLVRRRVVSDPRITVLQNTEVVGLAGDVRRVTGVLARQRGAATRQDARTLHADLIVDASGRSSRAPAWLEALGAEPLHEERIETGLAYSTGMFHRATTDDEELRTAGFYFVPDGDHVRGASVLPIEGGRHLVTLIGLRGHEPPTEPTAFRAFTARLPHPVLHEWLRDAKLEGSIHSFRATTNLRRRYDRGLRPAGFLATGDALCAFNPIYGQGMSVAALAAVALRDALADPRRTPTTRRVQGALLAASRQAWDIATGADKEMPGAQGNAVATTLPERLLSRYLARVVDRVGHDPVVGTAFRKVSALLAPSQLLFAPTVLRAVLLEPRGAALTEPPLRPEEPREAW